MEFYKTEKNLNGAAFYEGEGKTLIIEETPCDRLLLKIGDHSTIIPEGMLTQVRALVQNFLQKKCIAGYDKIRTKKPKIEANSFKELKEKSLGDTICGKTDNNTDKTKRIKKTDNYVKEGDYVIVKKDDGNLPGKVSSILKDDLLLVEIAGENLSVKTKKDNVVLISNINLENNAVDPLEDSQQKYLEAIVYPLKDALLSQTKTFEQSIENISFINEESHKDSMDLMIKHSKESIDKFEREFKEKLNSWCSNEEEKSKNFIDKTRVCLNTYNKDINKNSVRINHVEEDISKNKKAVRHLLSLLSSGRPLNEISEEIEEIFSVY